MLGASIGRILEWVGVRMKILVATDGSLGSKAALRFADRLAGSLRDAELVVITVGALRHDLFLSRPENPAGLALQPELEREERELASRTLQAAERELKHERAQARFRFVQPRRMAPVAETIAQEADREKADMIVVGTDRYGAFASWALGSVSARLLQIARRPVTVVHVGKRAARTAERRLA
jgi:nucleotide-binding universal stress UspA family protein